MPTKQQMTKLVRNAREELRHARAWLQFYARGGDYTAAAGAARSCDYWQSELNMRQSELAERFPKHAKFAGWRQIAA